MHSPQRPTALRAKRAALATAIVAVVFVAPIGIGHFEWGLTPTTAREATRAGFEEVHDSPPGDAARDLPDFIPADDVAGSGEPGNGTKRERKLSHEEARKLGLEP